MNEICKYYEDEGKCKYYKEKFSENEAAKMEFGCTLSECPIKNPWIISEILMQNS